MTTVLITGAGTGFGNEIAMRLAALDFDVIASVEIVAQIRAVQEQAKARKVSLRVEKLDVTDAGDREKALQWDVDVLLNNAGVAEGGSMVDIPAHNLRHQFEVNVIGPVLLTQGIARQMASRKRGKIVFMSSVAGLTVDPFSGAYSASKHAIEAVAEALSKELQEFGVEVATINPGPFLTGFNDRMFETWQSWKDDESKRLFNYADLAFPHEQYDPEPVFQTTIDVIMGKIKTYRNVEPKEIISQQREQLANAWERKTDEQLNTRFELVHKAYEIKPETPVEK